MTPAEREAALLAALAEAARLLEDGDAEAALPVMQAAASLCGEGAPPLTPEGVSAAEARFARCNEARDRLAETLREAMAALGSSSRAHGAYRR